MKDYLVIGLLANNLQRYATTVKAANPAIAEMLAGIEAEADYGEPVELLVAGVIDLEWVEVVA